jgi:hypothetical protein
MANNRQRLTMKSALLIIGALVVAGVAAGGILTTASSPKSSSESTLDTSQSQSSVTVGTTSISASSSGHTETLRAAETYILPESCQNCVANVPWAEVTTTYPTLQNLENAASVAVIGNVTSASTVTVRGVPVTLYEVTISTMLKNDSYFPALAAGMTIPVGQVGGAAGNETMALNGYPTLVQGDTYVLFLNPAGGIVVGNSNSVNPGAPFEDYVGAVGFVAYMTQGGPQGLFYVQGGNVYSLDNVYPQADSWLPIRVSGVPTSQFVQEILSAAISTTPVTG